MILDVDGERPAARFERDALRHGPRGERSRPLEPEVVVQPPGVVPLDDEDRLRGPLLPPRERLWCPRRVPFAPVLAQVAHAETFPQGRCTGGRVSHRQLFPRLKTLWNVWKARVAFA